MNEQLIDPIRREEAALQHITERLIGRYAGQYPPEQVTAVTNAAHRRYASATVRTFVPVFVERDVREALDARV